MYQLGIMKLAVAVILMQFCRQSVQLNCTKSGYFGENCDRTCHCSDNSQCYNDTGHCPTGCAPGYTNDICPTGCAQVYRNASCQSVCPYGTFGFKCSGICNCNNNSLCDKIYGRCKDGQCIPWYIGGACQISLILIIAAPSGIFVVLCVICAIVCCRKKKREKMDIQMELLDVHADDGKKSEKKVDSKSDSQKLQDIPANDGRETVKRVDNRSDSLKLQDIPANGDRNLEKKVDNKSDSQELQNITANDVGSQVNNHESIADSENIYANVRLSTIDLGKANTVLKGNEKGVDNQSDSIEILVIPADDGQKSEKNVDNQSDSLELQDIPADDGRKSEKMVDNQNDSLELPDIPDDVESQEHNPVLIDDSEDIYANVELPTIQLTKANIVSYVRERKIMEETPFNEEFNKLPKGLLYPCKEANANENISKNRYKTMVPYDHSRVTLLPDEISPSEYVNATFITDREQQFIASQGPTNTALVDFWRMIWQQKCNTIIMLTDIIENEKVKCTQYWPDGDSPQIFGTIHVKRIKIHRYRYCIHRMFEISKPQADEVEKWTIDHYFFSEWQDHGVPEYPEYFLDFRNKIKSSTNTRPPIVVHCSAGVGRTGTYICLDIMLEQMTRNQPLDVLQCVRELREERTMMVQKREQLEFIFDVLAENALTEDTVFCVESFPGEYNRITDRENVEISILKRQFQDLIMPLTTAKRRKIINEDYTDDEGNSLTLKERTVFINGHIRKNQFILTNTPTMKDVVEFVELVFHSRCQNIVMFGESIQEAVVYLPTEVQKVISCGPFNIELIQQNDNDTCTHRTLKISYLKRGNVEEFIVNHSQFKIWLDKEFPFPGKMLDLIKLVNHHHHQSVETMTQILVHCTDGTSKSGLFCAIYILTSMLETDTSISIVRLLRQIKKREPLIVPDFDSYDYCWLVGKLFQEKQTLMLTVDKLKDGQSS